MQKEKNLHPWNLSLLLSLRTISPPKLRTSWRSRDQNDTGQGLRALAVPREGLRFLPKLPLALRMAFQDPHQRPQSLRLRCSISWRAWTPLQLGNKFGSTLTASAKSGLNFSKLFNSFCKEAGVSAFVSSFFNKEAWNVQTTGRHLNKYQETHTSYVATGPDGFLSCGGHSGSAHVCPGSHHSPFLLSRTLCSLPSTPLPSFQGSYLCFLAGTMKP